MADEETKADQSEQQAGQPATDWEARYRAAVEHSREWEKKAKANKGAADELEKLKASQMTELERAQREAEDAKARLAALEAERERAEAVARVAESTGVPAGLLSADLSSEEGMAAFARRPNPQAIRARSPVHHRASAVCARATKHD